MPRTVYSHQFVSEAAWTGVGGLTVPDGYVWVVRDISVYLPTGGDDSFVSVFFESGGSLYVQNLTAGQWDHHEGRWIAPAGDILHWYSPQPCNFLISGYELSLP